MDFSLSSSARITLSGYALLWDTLPERPRGQKTIFPLNSAKFAPAMSAIYDGQAGAVLGTTANGTLRVRRDMRGVLVEIDLPKTSIAKELTQLVHERFPLYA